MNSTLVDKTIYSPNHSGKRTHIIDRITPHCVVGQCSIETLGNIFLSKERQASSNYGIGVDGRIGLFVDECNRSWCSSSYANDQRAVTIECASDNVHPYTFNDIVYNKLIELCYDICIRNGKNKLIWIADKDKALSYEPKSNEMLITVHRWFANKSCPGDWLYNRLDNLANKVTGMLSNNEQKEEQKQEQKEQNQIKYYRVQVGAYNIKENANKMLAKLKADGFTAYMIQKDGYYKVQIGAYTIKQNALDMQATLKAKGYSTYVHYY